MLYTKIVCTIGPSSREPEMLASLMQAGMDVARLNMSHGSQTYHAENIQRIRAVATEIGKTVAILVDLQGPKLRVGHLPEEGVALEIGQQVRLTTEDVLATPEQIPVQFQRLPQTVHPGDHVLMDDGLLELVVTETDDVSATCRVITGGQLTSNKGMNLPNADLSIASITEKDREDLVFALEQRVDWVALSFVRQASEVQTLKALIRERSPYGRATPVIAKIEKPEAMDNIDSIIQTADGIMVARGDLGIETSPEEVPIIQKQIIRKCNAAGIPVITATQMLDSMIRNPRPTRAEASDVANAILDGSDAIMLSGETAVGKYPARAVQTMARIARRAEQHMDIPGNMPPTRKDCSITEAVCHAATDTVQVLRASAVLAPTISGKTARTLAQFRPPCPIIAITPNPGVQHQLALYWGIRPLLSRRAPDTDRVIEDAVAVALQSGMINEGDTVVITAGTGGAAPGVTDLIKVYTLARTLAFGIGVGTSVVVGRVRRLDGPLKKDLHLAHDEIVVTRKTDRSFVPALRNAAGLISSEGGRESHCFLLAMELGLPAIIGIDNIDAFRDGQWVILDPEQGIVRERLGMRA